MVPLLLYAILNFEWEVCAWVHLCVVGNEILKTMTLGVDCYIGIEVGLRMTRAYFVECI